MTCSRIVLKKFFNAGILSVLCWCSGLHAQQEPASLLQDNLEELSKKSASARSPGFRKQAGADKIQEHIARKYLAWKNRSGSESSAGTSVSSNALKSDFLTRVKNSDSIQVYVELDNIEDEDIVELEAVGFKVELVVKRFSKVQGWIRFDQLDALSALINVIKITAPKYGLSRTGSTNTEGDSILKSNALRALGHRGAGIKVGVISDGSNNFAQSVATGDLPATKLVRYGSCAIRAENRSQCLPSSTCNEGTAMAEIIHDLAPDAEIAIHAVSSSLEFINAVNFLANTYGADIIVDDLGFFGEPYFQDGDIALAVKAVSNKVLFVSSAGNSASTHYEANFSRSFQSGLNFHRFAAPNVIDNLVTIEPDEYLVTILQWGEEFNSANTDYDLFLVDATGVLASSTEFQPAVGGAQPLEAFCYHNATSSNVFGSIGIINRDFATRRLEMFYLGAPLVQYRVAFGSVFGHPGVPEVVAVGAINANEPGNDAVAFYSSHGPSRIVFPALSNRAKPDVMGIDGVSVTGVGGFPTTFFGTSAAAPHVAGIAAQLMSSAKNVKVSNVREALTKGAVDLGTPGFDFLYGYGRVDGLSALDYIRSGADITPFIFLLLEDDN